MLSLPVEVFRRILRHATMVDGAFDTSYDSVQNEHRDEMALSITSSMTTKLTLSVVSKLFHTIMDEFLYEIIRVKDHRRIRPLAIFLRQPTPDNRPTRGWWCRRLEIDLELDIGHHNWSWDWGSLTLWGLLPACPRLVDFRCQIKHMEPHYYHGLIEYVHNQRTHFPLSDVMLKLIASSLATTLRRVELTGQVTTLFEDVQYMLVYLDQLESCRILGLQHSLTLTASLNEDSLNEDSLCLYHANACLMPAWKDQDKAETEEYIVAFNHASWPSPSPCPATIPLLPRLHTLHLSHFTTHISRWPLPSLVAIGAGFPHRSGTPVGRTNDINQSIRENTERIKSLTFYPQRDQGIDIWHALHSFPNLEALEFYIPGMDSELQGELLVPSSELRTISIYGSYLSGFNLLRKLYSYRQDGLLPSLNRIYTRLGRSQAPGDVLIQYFAELGVSVESNGNRPIWVLNLAS